MNKKIEVDENGCPTEMNDSDSAAKHCPPRPCKFCIGNSNVLRSGVDQAALRNAGHPLDYLTSWEFCQEVDTCSSTIDWESLRHRG